MGPWPAHCSGEGLAGNLPGHLRGIGLGASFSISGPAQWEHQCSAHLEGLACILVGGLAHCCPLQRKLTATEESTIIVPKKGNATVTWTNKHMTISCHVTTRHGLQIIHAERRKQSRLKCITWDPGWSKQYASNCPPNKLFTMSFCLYY